MKKITVVLVVLAAFIIATAVGAASTQITLLHVNDTHSHLAPFGPKDVHLNGTVGGLTKAASVIAAEKAQDPSALFVHGGDLMHGDLFFNEYLGVPELLLLQSLGLDAMVLGNHEFDLGPGFLSAVLNTTWPGGGKLPDSLDQPGSVGLPGARVLGHDRPVADQGRGRRKGRFFRTDHAVRD